jgi:phage terminase large subunit-like protein
MAKAEISNLVPEPLEKKSVMEKLAELPKEEYEKIIDNLVKTKGEDWVRNMPYDWSLNARPKQILPEPRNMWSYALYLAGRGFGKTRLGAETVRLWVDEHKYGQKPLKIALIGGTASDVNNVMVTGNSGILSCYPPGQEPHWIPTNRKLIWKYPDGTVKAIAEGFSSIEPDRLRGPQFHKAWCDEIASWKYMETWDMLMFCLRLGDKPQAIITTTPRPVPLLLDLLKHPKTWTIKGTTYENRSNLAEDYFDNIISKYEGTDLGRQEIEADILDDNPLALFKPENIEQNRISFKELDKIPDFLTVVLAIDPAVSINDNSADTGFCVVGLGNDGRYYMLHAESIKAHPDDWAKRAVSLYEQYRCDKIIAEVNHGGLMVESMIHHVDNRIRVMNVWASTGKRVRAEPIAMLYQQNKVSHVGTWATAEQQMTSFDPVNNPKGQKDMVDALVWAMTWLSDAVRGNSPSSQAAVGGRRQLLDSHRKLFAR